MAMSTKTVVHPAASTQQVQAATSGVQTVTVLNQSSNPYKIWAGTNPLIGIYPWYGTVVYPGASTAIVVQPGQAVYTHSKEPASLTVTVQ